MKEECRSGCFAGGVEGFAQILAFVLVSHVEDTQRCRPRVLVVRRLISTVQRLTSNITGPVM